MRITAISILTLLVLLSSAPAQAEPRDDSDFPTLKGPYLGRKPPGMTPELFAGDILPGYRNRSFSRDGDHFFLVRIRAGEEREEYIDRHMWIEDGRWTVPAPLDLGLGVEVKYPSFHPGGGRLIFTYYPTEESRKTYNMDICIADYSDGEFSNMRMLGPQVNTSSPEAHPTATEEGTLYFYSTREGGVGGADIYYSELIDGKYQPAVNIGPAINTVGNEYNPFIAPDGNVLFFNSHDRGGIEQDNHDIYISFRNEDGSWSEAVSAGDRINTPYDEWAAILSSDGKYLFFTSRKRSKGGEPDIYWVDAGMIEDLRP